MDQLEFDDFFLSLRRKALDARMALWERYNHRKSPSILKNIVIDNEFPLTDIKAIPSRDSYTISITIPRGPGDNHYNEALDIAEGH